MLRLLHEIKALTPKWLSVLLFLAGLRLLYPHWYEGFGPRTPFDWLTAFYLSVCNFLNTVYDMTPWWGICLMVFLPLSFVYCMATSSPEACAQIAAQGARDAAYLKEHEASHRWVGGWMSTPADIQKELKPGERIQF